MSDKAHPPLSELILRATLWMPIAILLSVLWLASWGMVALSPVMAAICLYGKEPLAAAYWIFGVIPAFLLARFLHRRLWEYPPSLL